MGEDRQTGVLKAWFALTVQERWLLAGVLAVFLVGLAARYLHLRQESPEPYHPEGSALLE